MKIKAIFIAGILIFLNNSLCDAKIVVVDNHVPTPEGCYLTIQLAHDAAATGNSLMVNTSEAENAGITVIQTGQTDNTLRQATILVGGEGLSQPSLQITQLADEINYPPFALTFSSTNLYLDSTYTITWTGGNPSELVNIWLDDIVSWSAELLIAGGIQNTGSFTWKCVAGKFGTGQKMFFIENSSRSSWNYGAWFYMREKPKFYNIKVSDNEQFVLFIDFNKDGLTDFFTQENTTGILNFYKNTGSTYIKDFDLQANPYSFAAYPASELYGKECSFYTDFDLDGNKDLLVYSANHQDCSSNSVTIYWGNSNSPYFSRDKISSFSINSPYCVAALSVDFNNDKLPDIFIKGASGINTMHKNNGSRNFEEVKTFDTGRDIGINFEDYNGDGLQDLVYTKNGWTDGQWGFRINKGEGNGNFSTPTLTNFANQMPFDDFIQMQANPKMNTIPDVFFNCSNDGTNGALIYQGEWNEAEGNFAFTTWNTNLPGTVNLVNSIDINFDGFTDIVCSYSSGTSPDILWSAVVFLNDGSGNFAKSEELYSGKNYTLRTVFNDGNDKIKMATAVKDSLYIFNLNQYKKNNPGKSIEELFFSAKPAGNEYYSIYKISPDGSGIKKLFSDNYHRIGFDITNDCNEIYYIKRKNVLEGAHGDSIWFCKSDIKGGNEKIIWEFPNSASTGIRNSIDVSSDRKFLIYATHDDDPPYGSVRDGDVFKLDLTTLSNTNLTNDVDYCKGNVSISPDNTKILYQRNGTDWFASPYPMYRMNVDGTEKSDFSLSGTANYAFCKYSTSGNKLGYSLFSNLGENFSAYIADADGSNPTKVVDANGYNQQFGDFSPDGTKFLIQKNNTLDTYSLDGILQSEFILPDSLETPINFQWIISKVDIGSGLLAYYPFNGNANDESGNDNHGVLKGETNFQEGVLNEAATFRGNKVGDYIEVPTNNINNLNQLTISAWVKITDFDLSCWMGIEGILTRDDANSPNHFALWAIRNEDQLGCGAAPGLEKLGFRLNFTSTVYVETQRSYLPNQWYHVVGTYNGDKLRMFVNGEMVAESPSSPGLNVADNSTMWINSHHFWDQNSSGRMRDKIDELRVYDRALNFQEIDSLYRQVKLNNHLPVSNAGTDQTVNGGVLVTLNGTGSTDIDGNPLIYKWTLPDGITLSSKTSGSPTFMTPVVPVNTTLNFTLVVNDGLMDSPADEVSVFVNSLAISKEDSLALVAFYNSTDGPNWTNNTNWLSHSPINTWYGLTVLNNQITEINLNSNNLGGSLPSQIGQLTSLQSLSLFNNHLSGNIPVEISQLINLNSFRIENNLFEELPDLRIWPANINFYCNINKLTFDDLEPYIGVIMVFDYAVQDSIDIAKSVNKVTGEDYSYTLVTGGSSNQYLWYKDGTALPLQTSETLNLNGLQRSDAGKYSCAVSNTLATALTLYSRTLTLSVEDCIVCGDHFTPVWTGNGQEQMTINVMEATVSSLNLEAGDEIGVYDGNLCVGRVKLTEPIDITKLVTFGKIVASKADEGELNGYTPDHEILFKLWDKSDQKEYVTRSAYFISKTTGQVIPALPFTANTTIFVKLSWNNSPPVADAGPDQTVNEGELVALNGAGSSDSDGDILTYHWAVPSGVGWSLDNFESQTPTFTAPEVSVNTVYTFSMNVNDGFANSLDDHVSITVRPLPKHFIPIWTGNGQDHMNFNVYSVKLDGFDLEQGDEIALYDGSICVGAGILQGTLTVLNLLSMVASADDGSTNGFIPGNAITYRVYDKSEDKEINEVIAVYNTSNPSWSSNGKYGIGATALVELAASSSVQQTVSFNAGWNIISFNVMPEDANMKSILQPLIDASKLKKVMNESGAVLEDWGTFGGWQNTIGNLQSSEGYKVNITATSNLSVKGIPVHLPLNISLQTGWNIISWPSANEQSATSVMQTLMDAGVLVKAMDQAGNSIEDYGIFGGWQNYIGNFKPGQGYKLNVSGNCTLTVNALGTRSIAIIPSLLPSGHYKPVYTGNGVDHMNINLVDLAKSGLKAGDQIGIFDGKYCVGSATIGQDQVNAGSISIPTSSDDGLNSDVNGFTAGHTVEIQLFRDNYSYKLDRLILKGSNSFEKNGSMFVSVSTKGLPLVPAPDEFSQFSCYPNPFANEITIHIQNSKETNISVGIYNILGQQIRNVFKGINKGEMILKWNGCNDKGQKVTWGLYLCKVNDAIIKVVYQSGN